MEGWAGVASGERVIDLTDAAARRAGPQHAGDLDLVSDIGAALNATLDLPEVFELLSDITCASTGATRCTLFTLDGQRLRPALATGLEPDDERLRRFRMLEAYELDGQERGSLLAGEVTWIADARDHPLTEGWSHRDELGGLALVPLRTGEGPVGLMVVHWDRPHPAERAVPRLLGAIGTLAGTAVRNAQLVGRMRRHVQLQRALAQAVATLAEPRIAPETLAARLVAPYAELLNAALCCVALVDDEQAAMTAVATWNTPPLEPLLLADIPADLLRSIGSRWEQAKEPIERPDDPWLDGLLGRTGSPGSWYLVIPLTLHGHTRGAVLLGFDAGTSLDAQEREAATGLASVAGAALERHELLDEMAGQLRQLDALYRISAELSDRTDAVALVEGLNRILADHHVEVMGVSFRDRRLAELLGGERPDRAERDAWRDGDPLAALGDGVTGVTMLLEGKAVGSLRVRAADPDAPAPEAPGPDAPGSAAPGSAAPGSAAPGSEAPGSDAPGSAAPGSAASRPEAPRAYAGGLDAEQRDFLGAVARGLAAVTNRTAMRHRLEESAREQAVTAERERIAADLHDSVGQRFVALGLLARKHLRRFSQGSEAAAEALRLAELAEDGKARTTEAIRAGAFVPAGSRDLQDAVRGLAESLEVDSGMTILVDVAGRPARVGADVERTLYRVAHEALMNAWRHAQCSVVRVALGFERGAVELTVTDDGVGLEHAEPGSGSHLGLVSMYRAVEESGGALEVEPADHGGTCVRARVPRTAR